MSVSQDDRLCTCQNASHRGVLCVPRDIFGEDCVSVKDGSVLSVTVDGRTANVNLETRV